MGESVPRGTEPDLFTPDAALDFENSLVTRLKVPHLMRDPDIAETDLEGRRERIANFLALSGHQFTVHSQTADGKPWTWGDEYQRVHDRPVEFAERKPFKAQPKAGLDR